MCKCKGAVCPKHPELEGLRYVSGHNCVGCKNDNATRQYEALKRVPELEAEVARLRAEQHQGEPVPALYTHADPGEVTLQQIMRAYEYAESHHHKYLRGTTNWCAAIAWNLNKNRGAQSGE